MTITLKKIYFDYHAEEINARALLGQLNWFCRIADFDPKTGSALPQALSAFLAKIARPQNDVVVLDRLWRITEHSRASVERLFRSLNESPRREQALMPVRNVRELDANSFIKLSNRPGRTIREKLAGRHYMQAVRRFQSFAWYTKRNTCPVSQNPASTGKNRLASAGNACSISLLVFSGKCLSAYSEGHPTRSATS